MRPWTVSVEGLVKNSKVYDRVYRSLVDLGEKVTDGDTVTILIPFDGGEALR
jgi:molybdopterin converting factor small subunit